jgi:Zn-dependent protease
LFTQFPSLQTIVMSIPGVVIGFTFHEFAHAWTATWFGDDTPRLQGRVSLNPGVHLDPLGVILLLIGGFGWAKPVNVNVNRLRPRVLGDIVVSLAGITMNFLLAILFSLLAGMSEYGLLFGYHNPVLTTTLETTAWINLLLVGFNLIPLPPLDGFHVLKYLFPRGMEGVVASLYRMGPIFLMVLFFTGIASRFLAPVYAGLDAAINWIVVPVLRLMIG